MTRSNPKKIKTRNWYAVAAFQKTGSGKHHTRERDVARGRSRKIKHKKQLSSANYS